MLKDHFRSERKVEEWSSGLKKITEEQIEALAAQHLLHRQKEARIAMFGQEVRQRRKLIGNHSSVKPRRVFLDLTPENRRIAGKHRFHRSDTSFIEHWIGKGQRMNLSALHQTGEDIQRPNLSARIGWKQWRRQCQQHFHGVCVSCPKAGQNAAMFSQTRRSAALGSRACEGRDLLSRSRKIRLHSSKFRSRQQPSVAPECPF